MILPQPIDPRGENLRRWVVFPLLAGMGLILAACGTSQARQGQTETELPPTFPATQPRRPPPATASPPPSRALMLAPEGSDEVLLKEVEETVIQLSQEVRLEWQVIQALPQAETLEASLVIVLPPDPGINSLVHAYPATQFISVGVPQVTPEANLSVIGEDGFRPDLQGFLAGFMAALVSPPDWRVAVITASGNQVALAASNGFRAGAPFYCGLCRPVYPPYLVYPQPVEVSSPVDESQATRVIEALTSSQIETAYVFGEAATEAMLQALAGAGIRLISDQEPSEALHANWLATIRPDVRSALAAVLPEALAGEGGTTVALEIQVTNIDEQLLTLGKQREVEETLEDLLAGYIDTGVDPLTGELR